jgi:hypothetical protein
MSLSPGMFGASKMGTVAIDLAKMKVKQLADELEWHKAPKSGRKRVLQLRLRALMISAAQCE